MNNLRLLDLPNEIIFIIFDELRPVDVFHSFANVNRRLDRLVFDPLYTRDLDLTYKMNGYSSIDQPSSIKPEILSAICDSVLSHIGQNVQRLTVEHESSKQVLAATYPHLQSLSLFNCRAEQLYQDLTGTVLNLIRRKSNRRELLSLLVHYRWSHPSWSSC